ncbi:uncharacterized protein LOC18026238 [Eutrema salsugineum]|nr:uncharacterized protein LOC18026238 [Eutrema salsugineum]
MRREVDSVSGVDYFPIKDNPQFSQVSFTQTITNRYSAIVPTNTIVNVQYDIERVKRALDSNTNIWNRPSFHPPTFADNHSEILNPEPLNVVFPHQDSASRQHLDMFSSLSSMRNNHDQHVPQDGPSLMNSPKPTRVFEEMNGYIDSEEDEGSEDDDSYDGRTHSLPYIKYGPYTCPKCKGMFETSQKFAAHMSSHYKTETTEERGLRIRARNKNKYRKLENELLGESQKNKQEDGASSSGVSGDKSLQDLVTVKKELV